jgi:hypothetical protein
MNIYFVPSLDIINILLKFILRKRKHETLNFKITVMTRTHQKLIEQNARKLEKLLKKSMLGDDKKCREYIDSFYRGLQHYHLHKIDVENLVKDQDELNYERWLKHF